MLLGIRRFFGSAELDRHMLLKSGAVKLEKECFGAPGRNRTYDSRIRNPVLYPLSYGGMKPVWKKNCIAWGGEYCHQILFSVKLPVHAFHRENLGVWNHPGYPKQSCRESTGRVGLPMGEIVYLFHRS